MFYLLTILRLEIAIGKCDTMYTKNIELNAINFCQQIRKLRL